MFWNWRALIFLSGHVQHSVDFVVKIHCNILGHCCHVFFFPFATIIDKISLSIYYCYSISFYTILNCNTKNFNTKLYFYDVYALLILLIVEYKEWCFRKEKEWILRSKRSLFLLNLSNLILIYFLIFLDNHLRNALLIAMGWQLTLAFLKILYLKYIKFNF